MPLVTSKKLLLDAQEGCYAVGAFNVENMEMVQAVVRRRDLCHRRGEHLPRDAGVLRYGVCDED